MTNMTVTQVAMLQELDAVDDAFCDIFQDQYRYLSPEVARTLGAAIDRLQTWRGRYGMTS